MIKNLLVALDTSTSSMAAQKLAIQLAKSYGARLSGIGIVDEPWMMAPEAIPLGGLTFKMELDSQQVSKAQHKVHELEKAFLKMCKDADVSGSVIDVSGIPSEEIEHFLVEYDLLVIGKKASFHFNTPQDISVSVGQLIKDNPRPILVVEEEHPISRKEILVAFDGSLVASRALHMAILLGLFKDKAVHIASVGTSGEIVENWVAGAERLCHSHGIKTHLHALVTSETPSEALLKLSKEIDPAFIVLGAYGKGSLTHWVWGSCAEELLKSATCPLFFFH